jgi:protein TonB
MAEQPENKPKVEEKKTAAENKYGLATSSFGSEVGEDRQSMKVAWIGALILHFALFIIVFPEFETTVAEVETKEAVVIKRYKPPEPPKEQPKKKVTRRRTSRVPIPDPTPDEPEPITAEEADFVETEMAQTTTEFVVGMPTGGPPVVVEEGPMRVGGEIQEPTLISRVNPVYPELARRARLEGPVILQAIIDRQGVVKEVEVLRGLGLGLDEAAVEAVSQWQYTPTFYNGRPVEVILTVTVIFELIQ